MAAPDTITIRHYPRLFTPAFIFTLALGGSRDMMGETNFSPRIQERHSMASFDDRENTFEKKFAHDQELTFKITARRANLLGQWATEKLGLSGPDALTYIQGLVKLDCARAGDEEVFNKIRTDFDANAVEQSDHQIRRTMDDMMETARQQMSAEG